MKFKVLGKPSKSGFKALEALLLPIWIKNNKCDLAGGAFSLLDKSDQKLLGSFVKDREVKPGSTKLIKLNKAPGFVFVAFDKEFTEKKVSIIIRRFIKTCKDENLQKVGIYLDDFNKANIGSEDLGRLIAEDSLMAHFDFSEEFKKKPKKGWSSVKEVSLFTYDKQALVKKSVKAGEIIGEAVNNSRVLANYPPGDVNPESMARSAREVAKEIPFVKVTVFDEKRLKKEGMNAILSVGKGSDSPPRLIIMEYKGGEGKPLALVGKGVTFDSGGLNIKPGESMTDMHLDMSGGAAVIYAVQAIAKLKLPINVIAAIPAAENMPSGLSYRMGDIIKAYGGKTIEIGHTDAEGRVIMADAIEYVKTKNPDLICTLATLTGAAVSALGQRMSALFVKDNEKLQQELIEIGKQSKDLVWPLPLWDEHEKDVDGNFADITNTQKASSRYGWALIAAGFLSRFAKPKRFVHIDMAPRMTTIPEDVLSKGSAGFGVRFFVKMAEEWGKVKKSF